MAAEIIDGKKIAEQYRAAIKASSAKFLVAHGRKPGLAVILAGDDAASAVYVKNKIAACEQADIYSSAYHLPANVSKSELLELIHMLNADIKIDGILVQLPLPKGINASEILAAIHPQKDVDGFSTTQAGNLMLGGECLAACTPAGCIELIKSTGIDITGKHAVVVGRSNIVGKPLALLLLQHHATVTVCHSKTVNLPAITKQADILVGAVGIKEFIKGDMIKKGAVVIDVGINRFDGKLYGDVEFESAVKKAFYITPVPGGVGPMTITMLLANTLKAACAIHNM